jgi:hypothetical protein
MDQKSIVPYLRMKGMAVDAIHDNLVHTLGNDALAYSTVTKYARNAQVFGRKEITPPEAPDMERNPVDETILTALAEFPFPFPFPFPLLFLFLFLFSSVLELSRRICLPRSTVHPNPNRNRRLTQSLRFTSQCDIFDESPTFAGGTEADSGPNGNRTIAGPLGAKRSTRQWHDIVTFDESWIYLFSEHDVMWTAPGEIVVDRERHTVQSRKFMLMVVWNPIGFHALKTLRRGANSMHNIILLYK